MSDTYAGNAASYPTSITIPDDGDDEDAASVNVGLEGLADRTANMKTNKADATNGALSGAVLTNPQLVGSIVIGGASGTKVTHNGEEDLHFAPEVTYLPTTIAQTLDLASGGQYMWIGASGTVGSTDVVLTMKDVTGANTAPDGYWIELFYNQSSSSAAVKIQRETVGGVGNLICTLGLHGGVSAWPIPLSCISGVRLRKSHTRGWTLEAVLSGVVLAGADAF